MNTFLELNASDERNVLQSVKLRAPKTKIDIPSWCDGAHKCTHPGVAHSVCVHGPVDHVVPGSKYNVSVHNYI